MAREHLTQRDREAIRLYVEERLTLEEVGARLRLSPSTVWHILARGGVTRRRKGRRCGKWTQRDEEIVRLYAEERLTLKEAGAQLGVSPSTVWGVLQKAGVGGRRRARRRQELAQRNGEIARLCTEGALPLELATRFGLSVSTVVGILRRRGVSLRRASSGPPGHLKERNREIARLRAEGDLTLGEIGERFGLSRERVRQIATRAGVGVRRVARTARPSGPPEHLKERNAEIVRLYTEGLKLKEIAARFGLSKSAVSYVVSTAGVSRRRPGMGGRKKGTQLAPLDDRRKRNHEIVRLYVEERLTCRETGTQFGLTPHGVASILHAAGVPRRRGGWRSRWPWRDSTQRTEEITRAYVDEELTLKQVGARFGLSPACVRLILIRAGVARRPVRRRRPL